MFESSQGPVLNFLVPEAYSVLSGYVAGGSGGGGAADMSGGGGGGGGGAALDMSSVAVPNEPILSFYAGKGGKGGSISIIATNGEDSYITVPVGTIPVRGGEGGQAAPPNSPGLGGNGGVITEDLSSIGHGYTWYNGHKGLNGSNLGGTGGDVSGTNPYNLRGGRGGDPPNGVGTDGSGGVFRAIFRKAIVPTITAIISDPPLPIRDTVTNFTANVVGTPYAYIDDRWFINGELIDGNTDGILSHTFDDATIPYDISYSLITTTGTYTYTQTFIVALAQGDDLTYTTTENRTLHNFTVPPLYNSLNITINAAGGGGGGGGEGDASAPGGSGASGAPGGAIIGDINVLSGAVINSSIDGPGGAGGSAGEVSGNIFTDGLDGVQGGNAYLTISGIGSAFMPGGLGGGGGKGKTNGGAQGIAPDVVDASGDINGLYYGNGGGVGSGGSGGDGTNSASGGLSATPGIISLVLSSTPSYVVFSSSGINLPESYTVPEKYKYMYVEVLGGSGGGAGAGYQCSESFGGGGAAFLYGTTDISGGTVSISSNLISGGAGGLATPDGQPTSPPGPGVTGDSVDLIIGSTTITIGGGGGGQVGNKISGDWEEVAIPLNSNMGGVILPTSEYLPSGLTGVDGNDATLSSYQGIGLSANSGNIGYTGGYAGMANSSIGDLRGNGHAGSDGYYLIIFTVDPPPLVINARSVLTTSIVVSWPLNTTVDSYTFTLNGGSVTPTIVGTSATFTGLTPGTVYAITATAIITGSAPVVSNTLSVTTKATVPATPSISLTSTAATSVVFSFTLDPNVTTYTYRVGSGPEISVTSSPVTVSELTPSTGYTLVMTAMNSTTTPVVSNILSFTTSPPEPIIFSSVGTTLSGEYEIPAGYNTITYTIVGAGGAGNTGDTGGTDTGYGGKGGRGGGGGDSLADQTYPITTLSTTISVTLGLGVLDANGEDTTISVNSSVINTVGGGTKGLGGFGDDPTDHNGTKGGDGYGGYPYSGTYYGAGGGGGGGGGGNILDGEGGDGGGGGGGGGDVGQAGQPGPGGEGGLGGKGKVGFYRIVISS